ncbi:citrate synthase-like protein [Microstroma glucosiphilum]|uniref:Citrate synthase n=1 Tax=Pseudomicrostroma glucosiphilum TaxID=1684307 RepID=A0A316U1U8_9BASI|nr:citrate synthase-like protein [Pseudomicrostroma glucosiphilum]PWN18461.1 citrate synthase-like protein [Pseudomicrostroma glucosiphilum]
MFALTSVPRVALRASAPAKQWAAASQSIRHASTLKEAVAEAIPKKQERLKALKAKHSNTSLGDIKLDNLLGGMRGLKVMLWEGSVLDAERGIAFHGKSIPDCEKELPSAKDLGLKGKEMLPESMLWLLLTGEVPTADQVRGLSAELASKGKLPSYVEKIIDSFPKTLHPMTQFAAATAALNHDSAFSAAYTKGIKKAEYWSPTFDDSIDLIAKLPAVAARIYYNVHGKGDGKQAIDPNLDLIGNFSNMLGYGDSVGMTDFLRLYIAIHGDHEGGNVSAHTSHLVGSALSDPFLSYSAALLGLAGPLHGLANQEVLVWFKGMQESIGQEASDQQIEKYLEDTLASGRVVPGYGHAVLRQPDPRFSALSRFYEQTPELRDQPLVKMVQQVSKIAPVVLGRSNKIKNPFPNVDAASGAGLTAYGMTEMNFYTVVFGVSRALGALPNLVMARALGLPIERPKSMSIEALEKSLK